MRKGRTLLKVIWPCLCLWWAVSFAIGAVRSWSKFAGWSVRESYVSPDVHLGFAIITALLAVALGWAGLRRTRQVIREVRDPETRYPYLPVARNVRWLALSLGAGLVVVTVVEVTRSLVSFTRKPLPSTITFWEGVALIVTFGMVMLPAGLASLLVGTTGRVSSFGQRSATNVIIVAEAIYLVSYACRFPLLQPLHALGDVVAFFALVILGGSAIWWTAVQR